MINLDSIFPKHSHANAWTPPSLISNNINSLSATNSGGIADRFAKVLTLICFLLNSTAILHLQDIRIPTDGFIQCLEKTLPNYTFIATANDTKSAGVVTIFHKKFAKEYNISHKVIHKGYILSVTFDHILTNHSFTTINTYLHASNNQIWSNQIQILNTIKHNINTIILGDFNHAQHLEDRSGFHTDKNKKSVAKFNSFIKNHEFQEISQNYHTFYSKKKERLISSRIDLAFSNFDYTHTALYNPTAKAITTAPYTVSSYGNIRKSSDWFSEDPSCIADKQIIADLTSKAEGGSHITDHLPLSIRFSPPLATKQPNKFNSNAVYQSRYKNSVEEIWDSSFHTGDWQSDLSDLSFTLTKASFENKDTKNHNSKDTNIWDAIRLVNAIDENDPDVDIKEKFAHIPDYLSLARKPAELVKKINTELAAKAYDDETRTPISKVQTIGKTLPQDKQKITQLYDTNSDSITDDTDDMTKIAHNFWGDKWKKKNIHNPQRLFSLYGKKILTQPEEITIDYVIDVINNTNNTAAGPDGIPFAAYRAVPELAAKILLNAIKGMMDGDLPGHSFNAGILHLLPKKNTDRIEDTRPLVINNTNNRIIATVIQKSINSAIESILSNNQNGFREGRLTATNIKYYNEKFYAAMENKKFYDIIFVDFLKAFDSIAHEAIFSLLHSINMPKNYINIIQSLFHNAHCFTSFKNANPDRINFYSGVKQGCPLSPTLFILIIDVLLNMLESVNGLQPKFFADDGAIGSKNIIPKLGKIKKIFAVFKKYTGLEMNVCKSAAVATGGRTAFRTALDKIGWNSLPISGNERYLGTYIGHNTTIDDFFRGPYDKFRKRLKLYLPTKKKYSLQSRVIIWNTWLLPIFSYVFQFHVLPYDYVNWIDDACILWLGEGNTMKPLHLVRPTKLMGLTTPLRDTTIFNYSLLAAHSSGILYTNKSCSWSPRSSTHRRLAREFLQEEHNLHIHKDHTPANVYHMTINSTTFKNNFTTYIKKKLHNINIHNNNCNYAINNCSRVPSWLPGYARETYVKVTHNALMTAARMKNNEQCFLCNSEADSSHHLFTNCRATRQAHYNFWNILNYDRSFSLKHTALADTNMDMCVIGAQLMLNDSIWRARCNAWGGLKKCAKGWAGWIVDNVLTRISKIAPGFFDNNFSNNKVPNRLKISYKSNLGSSKNNTATTRETAATTINRSIQNIPIGDYFAFTDGSAQPNPGPTGAGAAIYKRGINKDITICTYTAPIGQADNNAGEIFAMGMVLEHFNNSKNCNNIHIYTDSSLLCGAIQEGWSVGNNTPLLHHIRRLLRNYNGTYKIHWVPGHSDIAQNEIADKLAGAGAIAAIDIPHAVNTISDIIMKEGFLSFTT